ncbi:hypothetical protein N7462_000930 [Penicillium macrosclerotiorum]|uniref:uncharacterized protein n=1 Tax=Penicillium macrosclerotiorum TaxID=303699 RepID=UPI002547CB0D|nr:uncharacterized protein N7462_000930 [Penicillium macrosclerotiorum]KAJ5698925.1 hypothetical protein N7462_000930 [Penicillium macrosclerotiorum]
MSTNIPKTLVQYVYRLCRRLHISCVPSLLAYPAINTTSPPRDQIAVSVEIRISDAIAEYLSLISVIMPSISRVLPLGLNTSGIDAQFAKPLILLQMLYEDKLPLILQEFFDVYHYFKLTFLYQCILTVGLTPPESLL